MARLIQIRQRIKAIETIKKITHAMRLISMSNHSRLKHKEESITLYKQTTNNLFAKIKQQIPTWYNPIINPSSIKNDTHLIIFVGSQKGLCGNFNTALFSFFETKKSDFNWQHTDIITIGKKATEYIKSKKTGTLIATYNDFASNKLTLIIQNLIDTITHTKKPYSSVTIFSNKLKTFFIQKPIQTLLIPHTLQIPTQEIHEKTGEDYQWEQDPHMILDTLALLSIESNLTYLLFQSLLSEQAARFISMDSSTRNAEGILELATLQYNKLRQAKITKELTELTGSFT